MLQLYCFVLVVSIVLSRSSVSLAFSGQLTYTPCWMWQRLQIALCSCWTLLKVGTAMGTTVSPASLPRASPAMVGKKTEHTAGAFILLH